MARQCAQKLMFGLFSSFDCLIDLQMLTGFEISADVFEIHQNLLKNSKFRIENSANSGANLILNLEQEKL